MHRRAHYLQVWHINLRVLRSLKILLGIKNPLREEELVHLCAVLLRDQLQIGTTSCSDRIYKQCNYSGAFQGLSACSPLAPRLPSEQTLKLKGTPQRPVHTSGSLQHQRPDPKANLVYRTITIPPKRPRGLAHLNEEASIQAPFPLFVGRNIGHN